MNQLEVIAATESLIKGIRQYSISQKEIWQKIPWLALEADVCGRSNQYVRAYLKGFWALRSSLDEKTNYQVYVDLATGELIDAYKAGYNDSYDTDNFHLRGGSIVLARPDLVSRFAFSLEELDASAIVRNLIEEASHPVLLECSLETNLRWRTKTRENLGLSESYIR